jgi:mono/diheme cytochrome c family protein
LLAEEFLSGRNGLRDDLTRGGMRMSNKKLAWAAITFIGCAGILAAGCAVLKESGIPDGTPVQGGVSKVVNLDQGWSKQDQEWFWFSSQGSRIIRYPWFLALEQDGNTEPFRSNANMDRLRFLTEKPTGLNPDGLPVGFAKDVDSKSKEQWMGWTCAACHTSQVEHNGTGLRIDGGPAMADVSSFLSDLATAMKATVDDDAKFQRFAKKVLGSNPTPASADKLRRDLFDATEKLAERVRQDASPVPYGFARLDAFGGIFNQVLGADLALSANYRPSNAPVSFPFLWDTPQSDLVQWNGIASNKGLGPLARNVGEVLGVFAQVDIKPDALPPGYKSSALIHSLGKLEATVGLLWSPQWPMEYLPALDPDKAARGKDIYAQQCASCHTVINRTNPKRKIAVTMVEQKDIGTDPTMAANIITRTAQTGRLEGKPTKVINVLDPRMKAVEPGGTVLTNAVIGTILGGGDKSLKAGLEDLKKEDAAPKFNQPAYRGRPLDGIWATAPYLHNGSVPNLWQLLQPEGQRVAEFYVGSRKLDPVNVGFDTAPSADTFKLDTSLPGNSNAGHTFGTKLTDAQKWDLIEYMKSL